MFRLWDCTANHEGNLSICQHFFTLLSLRCNPVPKTLNFSYQQNFPKTNYSLKFSKNHADLRQKRIDPDHPLGQTYQLRFQFCCGCGRWSNFYQSYSLLFSYFDPMLSDVLVVFYPKNYIPSEQKAFEEASSWFYPVRQPFVKRQQRGDTNIRGPLKNHFVSFNIFKCRELYHPFNVNKIQGSDSDYYLWQMQRGPCVFDKSMN